MSLWASNSGPVLGHQGGWDEALVIILPLFALAGLLFVANRRANRRLAQPRDSSPAPTVDNADTTPDQAPETSEPRA